VERLLAWVGLAAWLVPAHLTATGLPDPTRPPTRQVGKQVAAPVPGASQWHLSMTRVSGNDRLAVINDRLVSVGGRVDGARVLAIRPATVVLEKADGRFTVQLSGASVKRPASVESEGR
jgi:hypothetical protein